MPTISDFHNVSPLIRVALLEQYGESVYGTPRYKAKMARDLDISPATIRLWIRERSVPIWVLLLLWEWDPQNNRETVVLKQLGAVQKALAALTAQVDALAATSRGGAVAADAGEQHDETE